MNTQKIVYKNTSEVEKYFNELDESGLLPKTISLRTIIPDENALMYPNETLQAFLYNQAQSKIN